jgi:hypothetical protein
MGERFSGLIPKHRERETEIMKRASSNFSILVDDAMTDDKLIMK